MVVTTPRTTRLQTIQVSAATVSSTARLRTKTVSSGYSNGTVERIITTYYKKILNAIELLGLFGVREDGFHFNMKTCDRWVLLVLALLGLTRNQIQTHHIIKPHK